MPPLPSTSPRARPRRLLPGLVAVAAFAGVAPAQAQDVATLQSQLTAAFRAATPATSAYVEDLDDGTPLFSVKAGVPRIPASVQKLYTTSTAIVRLGADSRLATTVADTGVLLPDGTLQGDLVLRGGGDPSFSNTGIASLAQQISAAGVLRVSGAVLGDESLFDVRRGGPRTGFAYDRDVGGVLSALTVGRGFSARGGPAGEAARRLVAALKARRIKVDAPATTGITPPGAAAIATVASPTIAQLAASTLVPSDNFYAETLLKDVGARAGLGGTTPAGAAVVRSLAGTFGVQPQVADGSGLARANRTSPLQVVGLLRAMYRRPEGAVLRGAMAVAGRTGTVRKRLRGTAAQDRCRLKTGTLRDVSAVAGICATTGGRTVGFAIITNASRLITRAHRVQDRMVAALARYSGAAARRR